MRGGGCVSEEKSLLGSTYLVSLVCMLYVQAHFVGWRMTTDLLLNDATFFGVKEVSGKRPGRARWPLFGLLSQTHLVFIFPICPLSQVGIDSDRQREMWWIMDATQPTGQRSRFFLNLSLSLVSGCPRCFWKYQKARPRPCSTSGWLSPPSTLTHYLFRPPGKIKENDILISFLTITTNH